MSARAANSIEGAIDWLERRFHAESARGLSAVLQFRLTGAQGGAFLVRVAEGSLQIQPGESDAAEVVLQLSARDCFAILGGRENANLLYMAGRLEIEGNLSLAMKLRTLFRAPD